VQLINFSPAVSLPFLRYYQYRLSVSRSEIEALSGRRASLVPSSPLSPPALDIPWPSRSFNRRSARYVKRPQAFSIRFDIPRSSYRYSATSPDIPDPVLGLHRFHSVFVLLSRSLYSFDFVNSFLDHGWPSTSFPDAFFDVYWYCSTSLGFLIQAILEWISFQPGQCPSRRS
jgi:hypothetical protein